MLNIFVHKITLDAPGVPAIVRKLVAASMSEHVNVYFEANVRGLSKSSNQHRKS